MACGPYLRAKLRAPRRSDPSGSEYRKSLANKSFRLRQAIHTFAWKTDRSTTAPHNRGRCDRGRRRQCRKKTEKPTEKKLRDARKDGEVPVSPDVTAAAVLFGALLVMKSAGDYFVDHMRALTRIGFDFLENTRDATAINRALAHIGIQGLLLMLPFLAACLVAGLVGGAFQTGLNASLKPVSPKFDSLNPANGVKKLFRCEVSSIYSSWSSRPS